MQTGSPPPAGHGPETAAWLDRESSSSSSDGCSSSDQMAASGNVFTAMLTAKETKLPLAVQSRGSPAGRMTVVKHLYEQKTLPPISLEAVQQTVVGKRVLLLFMLNTGSSFLGIAVFDFNLKLDIIHIVRDTEYCVFEDM